MSNCDYGRTSLRHTSLHANSFLCLVFQWVTAVFETWQRTAVASTSKISSMTPHCKCCYHNIYFMTPTWYLSPSTHLTSITLRVTHMLSACVQACVFACFLLVFFRQSATRKLKISLRRNMHELRVALWREIPSAHGNIKGAAASFGLEPAHASRKKSLFALSLPLLYSRIFMYKICEHKDVTLNFSVKTKPKKISSLRWQSLYLEKN